MLDLLPRWTSFLRHVRIDGKTGVMTVTLKDLEDTALYSVDLTPEA